MNIILNAIVLIFEVLYYALFMKFARKDGKFWKYFLMFLLSNILCLFISFENFYAYLFYFLGIILLSKLFKLNFKLYDLIVIILSMIIKLIIELLFFVIIKDKIDMFIWVAIIGIYKNEIIYVFRNNLRNIYIKIYEKWQNNNFYIKYFLNIAIFIYVISSLLYIIYR